MQGYAQGKAAEAERERRDENIDSYNTPDARAMLEGYGKETGDALFDTGRNIRNRFSSVRDRARKNTVSLEERYA